MHKTFFCLLGFLLFIPGCALFQTRSTLHVVPLTDEQRARLTDIPLPIDARVVQVENTAKSFAHNRTTYVSHASVDQVVRLYLKEMEYYHWHLFGQFGDSSEIELIFEKPTKQCLISCKAETTYTSITIDLSHRSQV